MTDCRAVFADIYARKLWGAGSGGGSDRGASQPWADIVSRYIAKHNPTAIISVGCGDGHADSLIDLHGATYLGIDVVPEMIDFCRANHKWGEFELGDTVDVPIRSAELVLCKEVTQHLSNEDVWWLISSLATVNAVIHCSATNPGDTEMRTGGYRPVWLDRAPFSLPTERLGEWQYGTTGYQAELWDPWTRGDSDS